MEQTGRIYHGRPENQKDRTATNQYKNKQPKTNAPQSGKAFQRPTPAQTKVPDNENIRSGDPFSDSIFGRGLNVRERDTRIQFTPSAVSLIEISRSVFQQLKTDDVQLSKKNQEALTQDEEWLLDVIRQREYILLEPISLYLRGFGNIATKVGQHLMPTFPCLPTTAINRKVGFYGPINVDTHNLYEEIPCIGVLAEAVQYAVSNTETGPYASTLSTPEAPVNRNLLGYKDLQSRKAEAKDLAIAHDISSTTFSSSRTNTAINIGFINAISDLLANSNTFKPIRTNFTTMAVCGAISQIISTTRTHEDRNDSPDVVAEVTPTSLTDESPANYGAAIYSSYQQPKSHERSHWLCITPHQAQNPDVDDPYTPWDTNRNNRRDLPNQYYCQVFNTTSQNSKNYRDDIITSFVTTRPHAAHTQMAHVQICIQ